MIEPSGRIQTFVWPGFHMIERSDRTQTFVWPGFYMIKRSDRVQRHAWPGGGGTPYNGLYGEAPPERGTFFRLQVYKRVGFS